MKYLLFFILAAISLKSFGQMTQKPSDLQNVIPPSPNASGLGKYADWPVSLYTGVPDINIPLYELKGRSIKIPVSLSYHASGIKVGEVASSVGLGWSLNGGGVITRSVRGLPDETGGIGYLDVRNQYSNPGDMSSATTNAASDSLITVQAAQGQTDTEPDLYMFNALGRSFKFYFSGDGTILTQPYSKIIIKVNKPDSTWRVTMDDGTRLLFGGASAVELTTTTRAMASASELPNFIGAWYLKKITTPTGEVIKFNYETSVIKQDAFFYQVDYLFKSMPISSTCSQGTSTSKSPSSKWETQQVVQLNLSSVESDLDKVTFVNDTTGRIDLKGGKVVKELNVFSKSANKYIHKFKFFYNYTVATAGNHYTNPNSIQSGYRLKLASIQEVPTDNSSPKVWNFSYNPLTLPSRQSYAQDHWGYYNGGVSNTTMLPKVPGFDNPSLYSWGERDGDSTFMAAEMLTKITYPTGGSSRFNFEPNSIPTTKDYQVSQTVNSNLYLTVNQNPFTNVKSTPFTLTQGQYVTLSLTSSFSNSISNDYGPTINLGSLAILNSSNAMVGIIQITNNKLSGGNYNTSVTAHLQPGSYTLKATSISQSSDFVTSSDFVSIQGKVDYQGSTGVRAYNQPVGGLRVKSIVDSSGTSPLKVRTFKYENPNVVPFDPVNGYITSVKDIKFDCTGDCEPASGNWNGDGHGNSSGNSISNSGGCNEVTVLVLYFNPDGTVLSKTSYRTCSTYIRGPLRDTVYYAMENSGYNEPGEKDVIGLLKDGDDETSHLTDLAPSISITGLPGSIISSVIYDARSMSTKYSLGSIQGGTVGYGKVTSYDGQNGENGYTVSIFSQAQDLGVGVALVFPYPPVVPLDWQKGLLLNETTYTGTNIPSSRNVSSYQFVNNKSIKVFKAAMAYNVLTGCYAFGRLTDFVTKTFYTLLTQQTQKVNSSAISYFNNGADSVITTTNYFYDNASNLQPTRIEALNSKGENMKTISRTALEKTDINASIPLTTAASAAIDTMLARNILTNPLETESYKNGVLVNKTITNYQLFSNNVLPQEVQTQDGANSLQSRATITGYDSYGNLLEQKKTGGPVNAYIWGYIANYPIAAVVNAAAADIAYTSFENGASGNWVINSPVRDSVTTALSGAKCYNLTNGSLSKSGLNSSGTYIISYWKQNGGPLSITGTVSGYPVTGDTRRGWTYYEHKITGQTAVTLSGTGNIDEVRLYPAGAQMSTYTYDPLVGITSVTDVNSKTTYYEYDNFQRLLNIRDQDGNIVTRNIYHYQGQ
ncbi:hypothetical protein IDJ77_03715 [Mucilaginibacter sp. ZT4R22]|uniref:YD repeat-containing protein n=1 Tax=Mucilaginibacter pankratovii TaxID=2772110 RepID=A0ABR7WKP7_9SPHI|nr:SpvB/TcaC N-terminal domain-containing protein [Mucilaginibacter pankratovii]MBD1362907.1 hypothetical protein [Mucilaginibacter pankratovii]